MVGAAGSRAAGGATRAIVALAVLLGAPGCSACESLFSASPAATAGSVWRRQAEQRSAADDVEGAEAAYLKAAELEAGAGAFANAARDAYEAFLVRYPDTKRPDLALADVHQAWAWAEKSDDVALQRRVLRGAFAILYFTGDLQSCQRALALFHDRVDPGDRDALSTWHNNAALLDLEEGQYRAARRHLREAKAIDDALYPGDPSFTISTNLVTVNVELGEVELATSNLTALMAAPQGAKEDPENPVIQYLRVRVARLAGDDAQAVALADLALAKAPDPTWARDLEYERARALEHLGQLDEAAAGYWRSIEHIETLRRDVRIDDLKPASIERHRRPFEALFMLELRRGRPLEALAVVERVEGRSFIDALSRAPLAAPSAPLALDRSQRRAEAFLRLLPELARTESRPAPSPTEVVGALAERHVLVYFRAGGQVWLGVISRARVDFKPIDAPLAELKRWIARLNADLTDREAATRLGQALLPRWALPAPKVTLSLVPDAELHRVPFALLPVEGAALIDRNDLAYAPSAGAIAIAVSRAKEPRRAEPPVVLAAGELQGAQREARWVAQRLGVEAEVGASADVAALERAKDARVLHIASHSGVAAASAWLELGDGLLFPHRVFELGLRPRLVFLSSCASGVRLDNRLWGSMAGAFFAAGADGVVASRWALDDDDAVRVVQAFYDAGGDTRPIEALATAQRALRAAGVDPASWAGLFFLGVPPGLTR